MAQLWQNSKGEIIARDGAPIICDECPCDNKRCWFLFSSRHTTTCNSNWDCVWSNPAGNLDNVTYQCAEENPWPAYGIETWTLVDETAYFVMSVEGYCSDSGTKCLEILANTIANDEILDEGARTLPYIPSAPVGTFDNAGAAPLASPSLNSIATTKSVTVGENSYSFSSWNYTSGDEVVVATGSAAIDVWNRWKFRADIDPLITLKKHWIYGETLAGDTVEMTEECDSVSITDKITEWDVDALLMPTWKIEIIASVNLDATRNKQAAFDNQLIALLESADESTLVLNDDNSINIGATLAALGAEDLLDDYSPSGYGTPSGKYYYGDCLMAAYAILESHCSTAAISGSPCEKNQEGAEYNVIVSYPQLVNAFFAPPNAEVNTGVTLNKWFCINEDGTIRDVNSNYDKCALYVIRLNVKNNFPQWLHSVNSKSVRETITLSDIETPLNCTPVGDGVVCDEPSIPYYDQNGDRQLFDCFCPGRPSLNCELFYHRYKQYVFFSTLRLETPKVTTRYESGNSVYAGGFECASSGGGNQISATASFESGGGVELHEEITHFTGISSSCKDGTVTESGVSDGLDSDIIEAYRTAKDALSPCSSKCPSSWQASGYVYEYRDAYLYKQVVSEIWDGKEPTSPSYNVTQTYWTDDQIEIVKSAGRSYWYDCNLSDASYTSALSSLIEFLNAYDKVIFDHPGLVHYTWIYNDLDEDGNQKIYYDYDNLPTESEWEKAYNHFVDPADNFDAYNCGLSGQSLVFIAGHHPGSYAIKTCMNNLSVISNLFTSSCA